MGQGIVEEALGKVFIPFFTTKPDGSGIGAEPVPPDHAAPPRDLSPPARNRGCGRCLRCGFEGVSELWP